MRESTKLPVAQKHLRIKAKAVRSLYAIKRPIPSHDLLPFGMVLNNDRYYHITVSDTTQEKRPKNIRITHIAQFVFSVFFCS